LDSRKEQADDMLIGFINVNPEKRRAAPRLARRRALSFYEQMAHIGSEVFRAKNWRRKNAEFGRLAAERALELLDLTPETSVRFPARLKELGRLGEVLADDFFSPTNTAPRFSGCPSDKKIIGESDNLINTFC
jgi:hypothetical protein